MARILPLIFRDVHSNLRTIIVTKNQGKIAKMLLDEANDFSCATTDVLAFKMLYLTSFF